MSATPQPLDAFRRYLAAAFPSARIDCSCVSGLYCFRLTFDGVRLWINVDGELMDDQDPGRAIALAEQFHLRESCDEDGFSRRVSLTAAGLMYQSGAP